MKNGIFLSITLLFGQAMYAAPCVSGSLQSYIALAASGCSVGSVNYGSFEIVPGQNFATTIDPANVTVAPGGSTFNTFLLLTLNQTANGADLLDLIFRVRATGLLTSSSVSLNSPVVSGNAAVTGILDVCAGGSFSGNSPVGCSAASGTAVAAATAAGPNQLSDTLSFASSSFFDIFFNVSIDGGGTGSALLPSATLGVDAVPEPSTSLLMVLGFGAIGILRSRRQKSQ